MLAARYRWPVGAILGTRGQALTLSPRPAAKVSIFDGRFQSTGKSSASPWREHGGTGREIERDAPRFFAYVFFALLYVVEVVRVGRCAEVALYRGALP